MLKLLEYKDTNNHAVLTILSFPLSVYPQFFFPSLGLLFTSFLLLIPSLSLPIPPQFSFFPYPSVAYLFYTLSSFPFHPIVLFTRILASPLFPLAYLCPLLLNSFSLLSHILPLYVLTQSPFPSSAVRRVVVARSVKSLPTDFEDVVEKGE